MSLLSKSCLQLNPQRLSWLKARDTCKLQGGDLQIYHGPDKEKSDFWYCSLIHAMFTIPTMIKETAFTIVSLIIFKHKMTCSCSSYLLMYFRFKLSFDDIGNLDFFMSTVRFNFYLCLL